jgi:hypothetical protein
MPATTDRRTETAASAGRFFATALAIALLIALCAPVVAPATASAQSMTPVTPPVAMGSTDVSYPPGALGDAIVVIDVVIAKDGTVASAELIEGIDPFAAQALTAVRGWRFRPARRGDDPVVARIRARVEFHHPGNDDQRASARPPAAAVAPPTQVASPPGNVAAETPLDVTIRGARHELGQTTLSAADVREMPGAFGDPFRAIEALPGVAPIVSGLPYFYIRGAPPNDTGYFVDGVRVPFLFHVGIGEGVVHPALLERVDAYPGSPPAAYGGYAGAVIEGHTREPSAKTHGEANLRLFDAGALVETPLDEGRGSALVAGRYGYPGAILGLITDSVKLSYWDYQARATWRLAQGDSIGVFLFGSHDKFGSVPSRPGGGGSSDPSASNQADKVVDQLRSDFHRLDLRYRHALGEGRVQAALTAGYDAQGGAIGGDNVPPATIHDWSTALRVEVDEPLTSSFRVRAGLDGHFDRYAFKQDTSTGNETQPPVPSTADPPPMNLTGGVHVDVLWRPVPRLELVPGARVDLYHSTRASAPAGFARRTTRPAFDPRLSGRLAVTPAFALIANLGVSHQYPALRVGPMPGVLLSVPGFPFGSAKLQRTIHASQGVEVALPDDVVFTATGFLSLWSGLTDLTAACLQIMPPSTPPSGNPKGAPDPVPYTCPSQDPVAGHAYGLEILVRRPLSRRLTGWLSYTLSHARREAHFVTLSGADATATVTNDFDRTHVMNAIVAYDLGRRWRLGTRFVYYSGAPYSALAGNVPVPPYNGYRGPAFFRLDVRLEKRWALEKERSIAFVIEGLNVTLSREVSPLALDCVGDVTAQGGTTQCTQGRIGPLTIPSLGVEVVF